MIYYVAVEHPTSTDNYMFWGEIWDKFTKLKFFKPPKWRKKDSKLSKNKQGYRNLFQIVRNQI